MKHNLNITYFGVSVLHNGTIYGSNLFMKRTYSNLFSFINVSFASDDTY